MTLPRKAVVSSKPREITDVLCEHCPFFGLRNAEHLVIRRSPEMQFADSDGIDVSITQFIGESRAVHLVEQQLHRVAANPLS